MTTAACDSFQQRKCGKTRTADEHDKSVSVFLLKAMVTCVLFDREYGKANTADEQSVHLVQHFLLLLFYVICKGLVTSSLQLIFSYFQYTVVVQ